MLETISTASVPVGERLAYWNEVAQKMVAPVHVEAGDHAPFSASIQRRKLRDCELLSLSSTPARVVSAPNHESAGVLNIQLLHRGATTNSTGGRVAAVEAGDFILFDPSQPLWLEFARPTQAILVRLPKVAVEERMPGLRSKVGVAMSGRRGPGAMLSTFLRTAFSEIERGEDDVWMDSLSDALWPLIGMAYAPSEAPGHESRAMAWRAQLFELIDAELCDPDLDVNRLARRMGLSARYIQMLFAEIGTTPRAFIRKQRLERAARRLERDGVGAMITSLAYDLGFNCLSSFCRSFRDHFGVSPDAYRRGVRG